MDDSTTPAPDIPSGPTKPATPEGQHDVAVDVSSVEFATFYQAEMPCLIRFLMTCGAREHDAADAAQRAFILLFDKWDTVRYRRRWLRTVSLRIFPKLLNNNECPLEETEESSAPTITPPFMTRMEIQEEQQRVLSLIRQLPPTQRKVFALYYDKFTSGEIAEILQMKEAAVRQNLARARAALKELLGLV